MYSSGTGYALLLIIVRKQYALPQLSVTVDIFRVTTKFTIKKACCDKKNKHRNTI